ncbi:sugar ABC transporter ATP-binding protein [uncultured Pseudacidovorax sp.]|uniref:sugar ABC transporter ATP-binding protein n=1 Tax=uncultured Pseudacidovorax sp. TaxID=679313 RepID=UPI0025E201BF|nr:sugar ABC transporter ATP-binding protein [uncultured Pseudacidovorax sp.]
MSNPLGQEAADTAEVLQAVGIVKEFGTHRVLDDVSFSLRAGQIHALLGENGAGKSTLIKILTGVHEATAGEIRVHGRPVQITSPHDAQAAGIAVVHQHGNLIASMTVQENLMLGRRLPRRGGVLIDWHHVARHARELLGRLQLDVDPQAYAGELRADQMAMVSIAKALSLDAKVIVLDEPTAALSPGEVDVLFGHMRRLAEQGHAFVFVSHRLNEIFEVADSATVLRDGKVAWRCMHREGLNRADVVSAILGKTNSALAATPAGRPQAPKPVLLEVSGLSARHVVDCSFRATQGEILGLAGLPDSGAEATLDALYGRLRQTGGDIHLSGRRVRLSSPREAVRQGFALVPKDRLGEAVVHGFSVRQNISLPSLHRFLVDPVTRIVNQAAERRAARDLAKRLHVRATSVDADIGALSGGNQQKCVLARWVATGAKVFLLNSPTAAVDIGAKAEIYDLLRAIARDGASVLFTSTEMDEYMRVCDRVLVFHRGRIVAEVDGPEMNESNLLNLALGERTTDAAPRRTSPEFAASLP